MNTYKDILESAGFTVSEPHDPTQQHSIYKGKKIQTKLSRYTITLGKYSYDNMIVSDTETESHLMRHFFNLFVQEREEKEKYKQLHNKQLIENERIQEHALRILYPASFGEYQI